MLGDGGVGLPAKDGHRDSSPPRRRQVDVPAVLAVFLDQPQGRRESQRLGGHRRPFHEEVGDVTELPDQGTGSGQVRLHATRQAELRGRAA